MKNIVGGVALAVVLSGIAGVVPRSADGSTMVRFATETQAVSLVNPEYDVVGAYRMRFSVPVPSSWSFLGSSGAPNGDYTRLHYGGETAFFAVTDYSGSARRYLATRARPTSHLTYVGKGVWFEFVGSNRSPYFYAKKVGAARILRVNVGRAAEQSVAAHVVLSAHRA